MLQNIRENAQGTIAKIIIAVLIVSLSIWGMDAIIGGFSGEPEVATVNGEEITEREFLRLVQIESQRRLAQMERPDPTLLDDEQIRREVLESLIQERVLTQDAAEQGLALSDADVDALITQMPQFQVDGQFSRDRFVSTVRNLGMGVAEFREAMRKQYVINQIRTGVSQSGFVAEAGAEMLLSLQNQTRDFRTVALSAEDVAAQVSVTEEEVADYYDANAAQYMRPETVDAQYIALSLESLADPESVSREAVEALYETRAAELVDEERRTAHILIEDGDEAEATLAEVQEKLAAGEDFAQLAETYSADVATAANGGDLGFAGRNLFDPAYEEAMFALDVGDVSEPVTTQFGTHLIKLLDVRKGEAPSLEELEGELRTELAMSQADEAYAAARTELSNIAYESDDLTAPAEALGLEIHERSGVTREGGEAPFDHAGLVRQLYSEDVLADGYNTEVIDVGDNVSVVARVKEHHPARQLPLEEVEADIRAALTEEKTREALEARAEAVVASLESGQSLAQIESVSGQWQSYSEQGRNSAELHPAVVGAVFALPRPEADAPVYGQTLTGRSEMVVIALDAVNEGEVGSDSSELKQLRRFMATLQGQREYTAYQQYLREQADVERP
ncbi:MAG: SurA N-terminal domain-containing protein [Marinobacter sp.]|uniref:SurA N-terminal domain-containing protein n=1 Tax=Marinobacter sp. TaxID=50741 RepID=UPI00299DB6C8|nr:SurA N-terminal domain-containing protein [Marinobacter sp.]MDX1755637.1 SurA N-terminal domain-containing protein [Marinobacter sp.]